MFLFERTYYKLIIVFPNFTLNYFENVLNKVTLAIQSKDILQWRNWVRAWASAFSRFLCKLRISRQIRRYTRFGSCLFVFLSEYTISQFWHFFRRLLSKLLAGNNLQYFYLLCLLRLLVQITPFKRCLYMWYTSQYGIQNNFLFSNADWRRDSSNFYLESNEWLGQSSV